LNAVRVPDGIDEAQVRARMLAHYSLEIGAGLGPLKGQIWRIGLMGSSATPWHVRLCLTALTEALAAQNYPDAGKAALAAAEARLAAD
jgi:alanine-glyoxylate transaminase/serine-glyoxylate transaminase/serine-pyruvate transaminase